MTEDKYLSWASHIRELNDAQIQNTFARLKQLGHKDANLSTQEDVIEDWLYEGLIIAFTQHNVISAISARKLVFTKGYKSYLLHAKQLRTKLEDILGNANKRSMREQLAYLGGCALVEYCVKRKIPKEAGVLLSNSNKLIEAIEDQYPGYIQANMFLFVLNTTVMRKRRG